MIEVPSAGGPVYRPTDDEQAKITEAAKWLASIAPHEKTRPAVPLLRERFGLSAVCAIAAIREAAIYRAHAH